MSCLSVAACVSSLAPDVYPSSEAHHRTFDVACAAADVLPFRCWQNDKHTRLRYGMSRVAMHALTVSALRQDGLEKSQFLFYAASRRKTDRQAFEELLKANVMWGIEVSVEEAGASASKPAFSTQRWCRVPGAAWLRVPSAQMMGAKNQSMLSFHRSCAYDSVSHVAKQGRAATSRPTFICDLPALLQTDWRVALSKLPRHCPKFLPLPLTAQADALLASAAPARR